MATHKASRLPGARLGVTALFAATAFLAAGLLFAVEPMVARRVLPALGGAPAVWTTCLLFFQAVLLLGYALAHLASTRTKPLAQLALTAGLGLAALLLLPKAVPASQAAGLATAPDPTFALLALLSRTAGPSFLLLATAAPMLQRWFQRASPSEGADPYFLYAASNAGSLVALVAYPTLIEPRLGLDSQSVAWGWGFGGLVGLQFVCGLLALRTPGAVPPPVAPCETKPIRPGEWLGWVVLAFIPSSLLMGVTAHLTTDIGAIPLLWVGPLGLYLLSFVLVFATRPWVGSARAARWLPGLLVLTAVVLGVGLVQPFWIPLHLGFFFAAAILCHGELADRRPHPAHLTVFFLAVATGGAVGGLFNALVAPMVFDRAAEYPLALVATALVLPFREGGGGWSAFRRRELWLPAILGGLAAVVCADLAGVASTALGGLLIALVCGLGGLAVIGARERPVRFALTLAALLAAGSLATGVKGPVIHRERDFFGVLEVTRAPDGKAHRLFHGSTMHGQQSLEPDRRHEPLTYFARTGPVGDVFEAFHARHGPRGARVAVTGVGVGTLAAYARPTDRWTFFELDPAVVRIARDPRYFTFLKDSPALSLEVVEGDARLTLGRAPGTFDLIVLDAFSSDAIPVHLLTREAVRLYGSKLAPGGWLAFNITNRYLDLVPVVGALARDRGWACRVRIDSRVDRKDRDGGTHGSIWAVLAESDLELGDIARHERWIRPALPPDDSVWTDDRSDLIGHLRWGVPEPTGPSLPALAPRVEAVGPSVRPGVAPRRSR